MLPSILRITPGWIIKKKGEWGGGGGGGGGERLKNRGANTPLQIVFRIKVFF